MLNELKDFATYVKQLLSVAQDVNQSKDRIAKLEDQVSELTDIAQQLVYELRRQQDEARHGQEKAGKEREILMLRIENAFLREGRPLPPVSENTQ